MAPTLSPKSKLIIDQEVKHELALGFNGFSNLLYNASARLAGKLYCSTAVARMAPEAHL
jgi:hypothetical protein